MCTDGTCVTVGAVCDSHGGLKFSDEACEPPTPVATVPPLSEVSNFRYLTRGYNIFEGNPDATTGSDEGFVAPIFELSYKGAGVSMDRSIKVPDGFKVQRSGASHCEAMFNGKFFPNAESYLDTLMLRTGLEASGGMNFLPGAFRMNRDFNTFQSLFDNESQIIRSEMLCTTYQASMESTAKTPRKTKAFQAAVKALPKVYGNGMEYIDFLKRFGTHYLTFTNLGAMYGEVRVLDKYGQVVLYRTQAEHIESAAAQAARNRIFSIAGREVEPTATEVHVVNNTRLEIVIRQGSAPALDDPDRLLRDWRKSAEDNPVPVSFSLNLITELLPASVQLNMHRAFSEYCKTFGLAQRPEDCRSISECESSDDCPEGLHCQLGQCMTICRGKHDCKFLELCIAGQCTAPCTNILVSSADRGSGGDSDGQALPGLELPYALDQQVTMGGGPSWRDPSKTHWIFYDGDAGDWVLGKVIKSSSPPLQVNASNFKISARFRNLPDEHHRHLRSLWELDISDTQEPDFRRRHVEAGCGECSILTLGGLPDAFERRSVVFERHTERGKLVGGAPVYISSDGNLFIYYCGMDSSWYIRKYSLKDLRSVQDGTCKGILHSSSGFLSRVWTEPSMHHWFVDQLIGARPQRHDITASCASSVDST